MTLLMNSANPLGCNQCWSSDAAEAWKVITKVPIETRLIDEPHYIVRIRACAACAQRYLQVTTETVDYADGEDPIYRTVIPIDAAEHATLIASKPLSNSAIEAVGVGRRSLKYDWPKGKDASTYWGSGVRVGEHD